MKRAFLTILTVCLLLTLALSAANADSLKGGKEKTSAVLLSTKDYAKFIEPYFSMNTFALGSYQQDWYYLVAPSDGEYTFSFKKQAGSWILAVYKDPQGIVDQIEITENRELYKIKAKKGEEIYLGFYINIGYIDFNAGGDFSVCFDGYHNVHETRYTLEEALCEKEGTIVTGTCSICGQITATETIPATGHTPGKEVVLTEPTCIQEGLKGIQCTVCKTVLSSEIIPTADHKPGKFETIVEPTCTNEGLSRQTCIVCHEILSEKPVPAAGHQPGEWNVLTQPTCTEEGIRARTCSVCGEVLEMDAIPALGHSFGSWTVTQMPTAAEPGIQSRTCSRCGETEMKALVLQTSGDSQEQMNVSKENNTALTNDGQEDKEITYETTAENSHAPIPEGYPEIKEGIDFGGAKIWIYDYWTASSARRENPGEEEQAQYDYRDWIMKTYNCEIEQIADGDWGSNHTQLVNFFGAPDGSLRLYILPPDFVGDPLAQNALAAWNNDMIDLTSDHWNAATVDFMTVGGKTYGVSTGNSEPRQCLYFNKRVLEKADIDWNTIYDMQKDGTWTWDAFENLLKQIQKDTDNDGSIDIWGMTGFDVDMYRVAVFSNGGCFFDTDENGKLVIAAGSDNTLEALSWCKDIFNTYFYQQPADKYWDYFKDAWEQGFCGFYIYQTYGGFNDYSEMADMADDWGCVAFPVGPKGTTYTNVVSDDVTVIPNVYDAETVGKLAYIYQLWSSATPGYGDELDWVGNKLNYTDERAVLETYAMLREPEHCSTDKVLYLGSVINVESDFLLGLADSTPAEMLEAKTPVWQGLIDAFNAKPAKTEALNAEAENDSEKLINQPELIETDPVNVTIQVMPDSLTGPGEVSVSLRVYNPTGEDMVFPVTLLDPDGNVVTSFGDGGSYIFKSGDSRSWEGKWNVTQAQLDAGAVVYTLRYHEEEASGSLVETKKQAMAKITFTPAPILTDAAAITRADTFVPGFTLTPEELGEKCEMLVNRINNETWKNIPIDLRDFPIQIDPAAILQTLIPEIVAGEKGNRTIKLPYFTDNGWVLSVPTKGASTNWHRQEDGYLWEEADWYEDELCFRGEFDYYTEKGALQFDLHYDENLTLQSFSIEYRPSIGNTEMEFGYRMSRPLLTIKSKEAWFDVSFFSFDKQFNFEFGFEVEYDLDGIMVQLATEKAVKTDTYSADRTDTYSVNEIRKLQGVPAKPIPGFAVDPEKATEILSTVAEEAPFWTDTTAPQTLNEFPLLPTMDLTVSPPLNIIETDDSVIIENHSVIPLTAGLLSGYRKNGMRFDMKFVSRVEPNESLYLSKEDNDIGSVDSCIMYALYSFDREDFDYSINWGSGYINSISYMLTKDRNESLDESYLSLWCGEAPGHNISISWDYSPFNGYYNIHITIDHEINVYLHYDINTSKLLSIEIQNNDNTSGS